ncbi:hypothetical protein CRE_15177 [Caenorhabditis remanei]|uniref:Uncharacterized protein n=1 Tax=Caenorhabditis remanei TaxID=31234 RepID=E3NPE4_CAERE|nr:hypothetical protein CRE_15177 [Caenorhabditis remanei]
MTSLTIFLLSLQLLCISAFDFMQNFENSFFEIQVDRDHPDNLYKEFEEFQVKYKRQYKDEIEKKFRFEQFVRSHNQVGKMNKKAEASGHDTKFGINKFSDRSKDEISSMFSKVGPSNISQSNIPMFDMKNFRVKRQMEGLPKMFDLRNKKIGGRYIIGDIKNQGECSCCWAFAATSLAEVAYSVHLKKPVVLSDQEVCDCAAKERPGCSGALPTDGLHYIKEMGLAKENEYEYSQERSTELGRCDAEKHERDLNPLMLDYYFIDPFNAEYIITHHLVQYNLPVSVAFKVGESLKWYKEGILELADCEDEKEQHWHSATIIGYGTSTNSAGRKVNYWILRNSWATDWGETGYARIVRGTDYCSMESHGNGARIPDE